MRKILYWTLAAVVCLALTQPLMAQKGKGGGKGKGAAMGAGQSAQAGASSNKGGATRGTARAEEVQMQHKGQVSTGLAKKTSTSTTTHKAHGKRPSTTTTTTKTTPKGGRTGRPPKSN